jgi:hypothetical protein
VRAEDGVKFQIINLIRRVLPQRMKARSTMAGAGTAEGAPPNLIQEPV